MTFARRCRLLALNGMISWVTMSGPAMAGIADDAQGLVERAAVHIQTVGGTRAYADFIRPDGGFIIGELYVFCMTPNGTVLVNAGNPKLAGKIMFDLRDSDGRPVIAEMIGVAMTQGRGWVNYMWPNLGTGHLQRKNTFVVKVDDQTMCGSGYYQPGPP